jgi:chromosome segregation ATPase
MHQREKIQVVFESVELEKEELRQERDALISERKAIAKDRKLLKEAIEKISGINTEGAADLSHAANKIKAIKTNTDNVLKESRKAIQAVKLQKHFAGITASLIILVLAFTVGIASAHLGYTKLLKEKVLASEIESIKEQKAELERTSSAVIELQNRGLEIYNNAIILPKNYTEMLKTTKDGETALFTD